MLLIVSILAAAAAIGVMVVFKMMPSASREVDATYPAPGEPIEQPDP